MKKIYLFFVIFTITIIACKDVVNNNVDIDERSIPESKVSFVADIQPIFEYKCNFSGCHADGIETSYMLTSWTEVRTYPNVIPGDPTNSILVLRVSGQVPPIMPPLGTPTTAITETQLRGIKTWIKEGAQNN